MKDNRGNATDGLERGKGTREEKKGRSRILTSKPQAINPFALCQHQQLPEYTTMAHKGMRRIEGDRENRKLVINFVAKLRWQFSFISLK